MRRLWVLAAAAVALATPARAAPAVPFYNLTLSLGWEGYLRPGQWTPVEVLVVTGKCDEAFEATLRLTTPQDENTSMRLSQPLPVAGQMVRTLQMVTRVAQGASQCTVAITPRGGKGIALPPEEFSLLGRGGGPRCVPLERGDVLVGLAGRAAAGVLTLHQAKLPQGRLYVGAKSVARLPADWTAYASLDLLVLHDPDWSALRDDRAAAIVEWVHNGGSLLVVLGGQALPAQHPLASLLPVAVPGQRQAQTYTVDASGLRRGAPPEGGAGVELSAWDLQGRGGAAVPWLAGREGVCAGAFAGFGRVWVMPLDPEELSAPPATMPSADRPRATAVMAPLVAELLGQRLELRPPVPGGETDDDHGDAALGSEDRAGNEVLAYLAAIPQMRPVHLGWVVAILASLALLLGPVDYFVLKWLDRQPATWLTTAGWITLFTVGAYYGVAAIRGDTMHVKVVTVLDSIEGGPARATRYMGLFAADSGAYRLTGTAPGQWWSAFSPRTQRYSGPMENFWGTEVSYAQAEGSCVPAEVPIKIWSMQALVCEAPAEKVPLTAVLERIDGQATLVLTNEHDVAIVEGTVRWGGYEFALGAVEPGAQRLFPLTGTRDADRWEAALTDDAWERAGYDGSMARLNPAAAYRAFGTARRSDGMERYRQAGAAIVCVRYQARTDPASLPCGPDVRGVKAAHTLLARLVIFPALASPGRESERF